MFKSLILLFSLMAVTPSFGSDILGPNFHEIDPGRFYRSAQLDQKEFNYYIQKYGIRTIISLRAPKPNETWYQEELAISNKLLVHHYDISMLAEEIPHRQNLIKLLDLYKTVPRPILIHCQGGADRSGEAAAIYQMLYNHKSREEALEMLTIKYHHVEMFKPAKRYFISTLWQGEDWAYQDYNPCQGKYKYYNPKNPFCEK